MKDIVGELLQLGDIVALNPPHYKGIALGRITDFTPKKVRVKFLKKVDGIGTKEKLEFPGHVVKVLLKESC